MGTLAQNLQSSADRLQELTMIFGQAANNNRWGDLLAILPQIQDIVTSTAIQLAELETQAVPILLVALQASEKSLQEASKPIEDTGTEEPPPVGQVADKPGEI